MEAFGEECPRRYLTAASGRLASAWGVLWAYPEVRHQNPILELL